MTGDTTTRPVATDRPAGLTRLSWVAALWAAAYTIYRAYYAFGGTAGLPGQPAAGGTFRLINTVSVVVLLIAAIVPLAMLPLWRVPALRRWLLALCWVVAVGCCMHALIDMIERVMSLTGHLQISYPADVWASVDRRQADLQDLYGNEPWFLIQGLLFAALAWPNLIRRRWWIGTAAIAVAALTVFGVLSATGAIGKAIVF
jgi:hypothetical protein